MNDWPIYSGGFITIGSTRWLHPSFSTRTHTQQQTAGINSRPVSHPLHIHWVVSGMDGGIKKQKIKAPSKFCFIVDCLIFGGDFMSPADSWQQRDDRKQREQGVLHTAKVHNTTGGQQMNPLHIWNLKCTISNKYVIIKYIFKSKPALQIHMCRLTCQLTS